MAGETIKTRAVCLAIRPWSRTSHIASWLTPAGCVATVVKGAVRPKSAFLGQYDLNYSCDVVYYAHAKGELHALRECTPLARRDALRGDFRALALADWFRQLALNLAPMGPDAADWLSLLEESLDGLEQEATANAAKKAPRLHSPIPLLQRLLDYELATLRLTGLSPDIGERGGVLHLRGEREIPVSADVQRCLGNPRHENNLKILVEASRVISVYYSHHLDCAPDVRRTVTGMICR